MLGVNVWTYGILLGVNVGSYGISLGVNVGSYGILLGVNVGSYGILLGLTKVATWLLQATFAGCCFGLAGWLLPSAALRLQIEHVLHI